MHSRHSRLVPTPQPAPPSLKAMLRVCSGLGPLLDPPCLQVGSFCQDVLRWCRGGRGGIREDNMRSTV